MSFCNNDFTKVIINVGEGAGSAIFFTDDVFSNCTSLKEVVINGDLQSIGASAFSGDTALEKIVLPQSLTAINSYAFKGCTSLTELSIPGSVTTGAGIVNDSGVKTLIYEEGSKTTGYTEILTEVTNLETLIINRPITVNCSGLTNLKSVTFGKYAVIGASKFQNCTGLKEITISNSVTQVQANTFSTCTALETITIEDGDSPISCGDNAFGTAVVDLYLGRSAGTVFANSTNLENLTVGSQVTSLTKGAFANCDNIEHITFTRTTPPTGIKAAFGEAAHNAVITVPAESIAAYKKALGSEFVNVVPDKTVIETINGIEYEVVFGGGTNGKDVVRVNGAEDASGNVTIPETVTLNGKTYSVTIIAPEAFKDNTGITSITVPGSVKNIGESAFRGCSQLTNINIGRGVTNIDANVFEGCTSLTEVILPSTLTSLGENAFTGSSVTKVLLPSSVAAKITLPDSIEVVEYPRVVEPVIENGYVYGTDDGVKTFLISVPTDVTEVEIPATVTTIYMGAFEGCTELTQVTIPGTVKEICEGAFKGCSKLTTVNIEEGVTTIAANVFEGCDELNAIVLPSTITKVNEAAFEGCSAKVVVSEAVAQKVALPATVKAITVPEGVVPVVENGYVYGTVDGVKTVLISVPTDVTEVEIPETVTTIYKGAFEGCTELTQVTIPGTVKEIGEGAFKGCSKLTTVNIEEGVTEIAANVFEGCDELNAIVLPSTITKVDEAAFAGSSDTKVLVPEAIAQKVTLPSTVQTIAFPEGVVPVVENGYVYGTVDGVKTVLISVPTDVTEVEIPSTVTTIYKGAFEGCSQLTQVTIPATVKEIGEGAFKGCSNLKEVVLEGNETAGTLTVGKDAFDGTNVETLYQNRNTEGEPFSGNENLKNVT
ncbi:MAG: leucine-rich repeat domain-containing protein, partial [Muribaculaceae bacterium]|nr:leucine-rich repeat domain-containing protein [Muribaculaceae bacterium]